MLAQGAGPARHQGPRRRPGHRAGAQRRRRWSSASRREGGTEKIEVDQVLVAIGRRPVTEDIGLDAAGVDRHRARLRRRRHRDDGDQPARRVRDRRRRGHARSGARRVRRGDRRDPGDPRRDARCRWTTPACRGWSTPTRGGLGRADRGRGTGGRPRRRGAQAQVRRQRPRHDHRRDRRHGEGRRREGRPDPRLPSGRPVGQRTARRGLPGGQLAGDARGRRRTSSTRTRACPRRSGRRC